MEFVKYFYQPPCAYRLDIDTKTVRAVPNNEENSGFVD